MIIIVNGWLGLKRRDLLADPHVLGLTDLINIVRSMRPLDEKLFGRGYCVLFIDQQQARDIIKIKKYD